VKRGRCSQGRGSRKEEGRGGNEKGLGQEEGAVRKELRKKRAMTGRGCEGKGSLWGS